MPGTRLPSQHNVCCLFTYNMDPGIVWILHIYLVVATLSWGEGACLPFARQQFKYSCFVDMFLPVFGKAPCDPGPPCPNSRIDNRPDLDKVMLVFPISWTNQDVTPHTVRGRGQLYTK